MEWTKEGHSTAGLAVGGRPVRLGQEKGARSQGWRRESRASSLGHSLGLSAEDGAEEFGREEAEGSLSGAARIDVQRCDPQKADAQPIPGQRGKGVPPESTPGSAAASA